MNIPKDPFMLYSFINTQLRDKYSSLDELCASLCIEKSEICSSLSAAGFEYDEALNKFM